MTFKMRILHFSKAGNSEAMAQAIQRQQKAGCDKIPPAYPCESEKLVFIGIEGAKKPAKQVVEFCNSLTPQRAKNVAFFAIGTSFEAVDELSAIVKKNGVGIAGKPFLCTVKGGLFSQGKVSEDDLKKAAAWSDEVVKSLAQ